MDKFKQWLKIQEEKTLIKAKRETTAKAVSLNKKKSGGNTFFTDIPTFNH